MQNNYLPNNQMFQDKENEMVTRLTRIVERRNNQLTDNLKHTFNALCRFVIFFENIKYPFFEALIKSLYDKLDSWYGELSAKYNGENLDINGINYDYNRAFYFLKTIGRERATKILKVEYPYANINAIIDGDYDQFLDKLPLKGRHKMLAILSEMQYVILGCLDKPEPDEEVSDTCFDKIFRHSLWTKKGILYELFNNNDAEGGLNLSMFELAEANGLLTYEYLTKEILQDTPCGIIGKSTINNDGIGFLNAVCDRCAYYIIKALTKSVQRPLEEYNIEIDNQDPYYDNYSWLVKMKDTFGTDNGIEMLDIGISKFIQKMQEVYSDEVKRIIDTETKKIVESFLEHSQQPYFSQSVIATKKLNITPSIVNDEYKDIIEAWINKVLNKKTNKGSEKTPFSLKLKDDEIEKIYNKLIENEFLAKRTTLETFKYVLTGSKLHHYNEPIIWVKLAEKNRTYNKKSVLNFLRLLGISWNEITPTRLNYCFICEKKSTNFTGYNANSFAKRTNQGQKCVKGKYATSEYNTVLKEIIESSLGKGHYICARWEKMNLDELNEQQ